MVVLALSLAINTEVRAQSTEVQAQSLDKELSTLAANLGKALASQGIKNVAAVDFTDIQGQPTELGRHLSELLTVEMVLAGGISMLDRANTNRILAENKLTVQGLVNPANAKKLGEFAGVDVFLMGTVTSLDAKITLTVKAIATESSRIVTAGRITFPTTSDIQQLLNRGLFAGSTTATAPAGDSASGGGGTPSYREGNAIASKDVGALRVVLKSAVPMRLQGQDGRSRSGFRLSIELLNRDLQRPMVVAMNADAAPERQGTEMGASLRTSLIDERGTVWRLSPSAVTGVSVVGVGRSADSCAPGRAEYNPAEIVLVLQRWEGTGSQTATDIREGATCGPYQFVYGSTTPIPAGQNIAVTMSFVQDASETNSGAAPKSFQLSAEFVVGVVTTGTRRSYSLHNLIFDGLTLPRIAEPVPPRRNLVK
ncbi:MAG TPA: FlgO family outer membrane protein [Vicinamibacterales bacterium]|nr:FlgO family outer membrane protein [Vicinamibacterales bacterium]